MEYSEETFSATSALPPSWAGHTYEQCRFEGLDLSNAHLSNAHFLECTFADCNLANAFLKNSKLNNVVFVGCKLMGLDFSTCSPFAFEVRFQDSLLDLAVFHNQKLKKTRFDSCRLHETHLVLCDLTQAVFNHCDLALARFSECNLTQADFSTSDNLTLNPEDNTLKKAVFSMYQLPALLEKYELVIKP
jgi:uncharacterized protein YjbI with pentapeptide repeats